MSNDNVFDEELDYEMDDHNEDELLQSDEEAKACEIVKLMSSASVTSPKTLPEPEKPSLLEEKVLEVAEAAGVESVKEVLVTPTYLHFQTTSSDLWEKSISAYYAKVNENVTSPTKEAVQSNDSQKIFRKPQRTEILAPKEVKIQGRSAVTYGDLWDLDATKLFSPMISLQTKSIARMNGSSNLTVVNETNGYASDLLSKFDSLSTKSMSSKDENEDTSVGDLCNQKLINGILEKNVQHNIYRKINGFGCQPLEPTKKIPFIIETNATSRKVLVNPLFDGFSRNTPNKCSVSVIRKRQRSRDRNHNGYAITDLRDKILKKRKPSNIMVESNLTNKNDKVFPKGNQEILIPNDEERDYLKEIEKQKLKREQTLRQKEINRQKEGWNFI